MTLAVCLQKVVAGKAMELMNPDGTVVLKEKNVMAVEVSELTPDAVVLRIGRLGSLSGVKDGRWKQVCDYLVIDRGDGKIRVLFVELKRTLSDSSKGFEQLRRSLPLFHHLRSMCAIECGPDPQPLEIRYALVAARGSERLDKQRVRANQPLPSKLHEGIRIAVHISGSRVGLNRLWGA